MSPETASAVELTRSALHELDNLVSGQWELTRHPGAGAGQLVGFGDPSALVTALTNIGALFSTASLTGRFANARLTLTVLSDGSIAPNVIGEGDINDTFDISDRNAARLAWAGDTAVAFALPGGTWSATVQVSWASALDVASPDTQWAVFWNAGEAVLYLRSQGFLNLKSAFDSERGAVFLIRGLEVNATIESPALTVASLDSVDFRLPAPTRAVGQAMTDTNLVNSVDPRLLLPVVADDALTAITETLSSAIVGTCWARLATSMTVGVGGDVEVEYFGLQRVRHKMPAVGPAANLRQARKSVELLNWVESDGKVDRLIAARQVISLRTDDPPWDRPEDIEIAAEPIFRALRADAIAEALKAQREARTAALGAAQRSVEAASAIAKGTAEKAIAAVVAIGAILTGNTTNQLSADQASKLQLLVAATLVGLSVWNVVVERPALFRPVNDFKSDLGTVSELLSKKDRKRIGAMNALTRANGYAMRVAWSVPTLYVMLAAAAVLID